MKVVFIPNHNLHDQLPMKIQTWNKSPKLVPRCLHHVQPSWSLPIAATDTSLWNGQSFNNDKGFKRGGHLITPWCSHLPHLPFTLQWTLDIQNNTWLAKWHYLELKIAWIQKLHYTDTCSQCRSLSPGLQIICNSGMWTLNLSTLLLTLSATLRGPGASLNVLVSFKTVLYILPISSSTSSEFMSVNGPFKMKQ